jgi:pectin lyase
MFTIKPLKWLLLFALVITSMGLTPANVSHAAEIYPYQAMRLENVNNKKNLNILGFGNNAEVNVWHTNGESNERWRLSTSDGVYFKLINERTGLLVSPSNWSLSEGNATVLYEDLNRDEQLWRIISVDKDANGDDLTYRIMNKADTNKALALNVSSNKTMITSYANETAQKWKLVSDGLVGFAGHSTDMNGQKKTGTIGGVLGRTVFVNSLAELKSALLDPNPLTIVITSNIDNANSEMYDLRIASNKTIIGSYAANRLTDPRLRTDDYFKVEPVSHNIIIKNLDIQIKERKDVVAIAVYGSRNVWVDHNTFNSTLGIDRDEVGKYIWVNESTYTNTDPDFITLSYNKYSNRYWTIAFGANASAISNNATVMFNHFDSTVRRTPQTGNGRAHILNNLIQRTSPSVGNDPYASIIGGEKSHVYSEGNRFEGFVKESSGYWDIEIMMEAGKDIGSYTNKGENAPVSNPYLLPTPEGLPTGFDPAEHYDYPILPGYTPSGYDVKGFVSAQAGASHSSLKYIHYPEFHKYLQ